MRSYSIVIVAVCLFGASCAELEARPLAFTPFQISGAANVQIAGINDSGTAAGLYWPTNSTAISGFVGRSGHVTTLASPVIPGYKPIPVPTSINNQGYVAGNYMAGPTEGFIWASGKYLAVFATGNHSSGVPAPTISAGNTLGYNFDAAFGVNYIYAGKYASPHRVNVGGFAVLQSINSNNLVAGQFEWFVGSSPTNAVFLAQPTGVEPLLPQGAKSSAGGFLNEQGKVAGSFISQAGVAKGFLYSSGNYQLFDMPSLPSEVTVQGIDSVGTVVGTYVDSIAQHGFIYQSGKVTDFGKWDINDTVQVRISSLGAWVAVSIQSASSKSSRAFLAHCSC